MASPSHDSSERPYPDHVILEWRGLQFTYVLARLFAAFWLSLFVMAGCFWIILAPTAQVETNAAVAILSSVVTAWISYLTRQVG